MSYIFTAVQISYNPTHAKKKIDHKNWKSHNTMKFHAKSMSTLQQNRHRPSQLSFVSNPIHNDNPASENHRKKRKIKHSCDPSHTFQASTLNQVPVVGSAFIG